MRTGSAKPMTHSFGYDWPAKATWEQLKKVFIHPTTLEISDAGTFPFSTYTILNGTILPFKCNIVHFTKTLKPLNSFSTIARRKLEFLVCKPNEVSTGYFLQADRYFCRRLLGLSGMLIPLRPAPWAGASIGFPERVRRPRPKKPAGSEHASSGRAGPEAVGQARGSAHLNQVVLEGFALKRIDGLPDHGRILRTKYPYSQIASKLGSSCKKQEKKKTHND